MRFFSDHFRFIRYDERGCGMSDRHVEDVGFDRWIEDLEAVVEETDLTEPFALLGISQGAAAAIAYAAKYPERVSALYLYGGYARGWKRRNDPESEALIASMVQTLALGWDLENPLFRTLFTARFIPGGTQTHLGWYNDLCVKTMSAQMAAKLNWARGEIEVTDLLRRIACPTLIAHVENDEIAPLAEGRLMATHIPKAELVVLDSRNHILLPDEPSWEKFQKTVLAFAGRHHSGQAGHLRAELADLSARERDVLMLIAEAKSNPEIAAQLDISEKTVRNHTSNLFRKLGVKSRSEAMLYVHRLKRG